MRKKSFSTLSIITCLMTLMSCGGGNTSSSDSSSQLSSSSSPVVDSSSTPAPASSSTPEPTPISSSTDDSSSSSSSAEEAKLFSSKEEVVNALNAMSELSGLNVTSTYTRSMNTSTGSDLNSTTFQQSAEIYDNEVIFSSDGKKTSYRGIIDGVYYNVHFDDDIDNSIVSASRQKIVDEVVNDDEITLEDANYNLSSYKKAASGSLIFDGGNDSGYHTYIGFKAPFGEDAVEKEEIQISAPSRYGITTVTYSSYLEHDASTASATNYLYDITLRFDEDKNVVGGSYLQYQSANVAAWDYDNHAPITEEGNEDRFFFSGKESLDSYKIQEEKISASEPAVSLDGAWATSLTNVKLYSENDTGYANANKINTGEALMNLTLNNFDIAPYGAVDSSSMRITKSGDENIIAYNETWGQWIAKSAGTVTMYVGNSFNDELGSVEVTVTGDDYGGDDGELDYSQGPIRYIMDVYTGEWSYYPATEGDTADNSLTITQGAVTMLSLNLNAAKSQTEIGAYIDNSEMGAVEFDSIEGTEAYYKLTGYAAGTANLIIQIDEYKYNIPLIIKEGEVYDGVAPVAIQDYTSSRFYWLNEAYAASLSTSKMSVSTGSTTDLAALFQSTPDLSTFSITLSDATIGEFTFSESDYQSADVTGTGFAMLILHFEAKAAGTATASINVGNSVIGTFDITVK